MSAFLEAAIVLAFLRRQRRLNSMARAWIELPQVVDSGAPITVARTLVESADENAQMLLAALEGRSAWPRLRAWSRLGDELLALELELNELRRLTGGGTKPEAA
jgi:hypothetical protein